MSDAEWFGSIALWLVLGWIAFAFFERRAMLRGGKYKTLSFAVYNLGRQWPLSILAFGVLVGVFLGGLGVHFYWHWCPEGSISTGLLDKSYQIK